MKITKLLAMLLALCMILCCFAACDSSDDEDKDEDEKVEEKDDDKDEDEDDKSKDDDEDEDEDEDDKSKDDDEDEDDKPQKDDDKDEDEEETKKPVVSSDDELEGEWEGTVDLADVIASMGVEIDASLEIGFVFEFDGDECTFKAIPPSQKDVEKFTDAYIGYVVDIYKEGGITDEDEIAEMMGYDSYDEFYADGLAQIEDMVVELENSENSGSYEYEDGVLTIEGDVEIEIDLDGDTFVVVDANDENIAMVLTGVEFERQ